MSVYFFEELPPQEAKKVRPVLTVLNSSAVAKERVATGEGRVGGERRRGFKPSAAGVRVYTFQGEEQTKKAHPRISFCFLFRHHTYRAFRFWLREAFGDAAST